MTAHRLLGLLHDPQWTGELRALGGAGDPDDEKDVWLRAVNCPRCLASRRRAPVARWMVIVDPHVSGSTCMGAT
ncbi:hypothetical protein ABR738_12355 [Streptomyces sp. Edi4]|uniref:hypothetical protein n=1 Tax=Streptomyces sp. Edi4 TaxID=3162527 RepID=UPI003306210A